MFFYINKAIQTKYPDKLAVIYISTIFLLQIFREKNQYKSNGVVWSVWKKANIPFWNETFVEEDNNFLFEAAHSIVPSKYSYGFQLEERSQRYIDAQGDYL